MHTSKGVLRYSQPDSLITPYKLIVEIDPGIAEFYRSMIPRLYYRQSPLYAPHISVVRKEVPPHLDLWGRHDGNEVDFSYDPTIQYQWPYWWLSVYSQALVDIRVELGLPAWRKYNCPPDGSASFHITIANSKER